MVITDDRPGALKAIRQCWPATGVQRCLFHVWLNTKTDLTGHPKTPAGKALLRLGGNLAAINTLDEAATWATQLNNWWNAYGYLTRERTYNTSWQPGQQHWWYTHYRLRRAYLRLAKLLANKSLFTHLDPSIATLGIARTTSSLEGGINAGIRKLLAAHKGLSQGHMRTAVQWFLNNKSIHPHQPVRYLTSHYQPPAHKPLTTRADNPGTPARYDTTIDYNTNYQDGSLHIKKGWAGHQTPRDTPTPYTHFEH